MMVVRRFILSGLCIIALLALAACNSGGDNGASAQSSSSAHTAATNTPQLVTPKSSSGKPGQGAQVLATPSPVPGGPKGSQEVVLGDRTLIIYKASTQKSANANSTFVKLDLAIMNTSEKEIQNLSAFFQLIGLEGDIFSYQYNSTDTFYGPVAAHTTATGSIVFQLPTAATTKLNLLYRPEIAQETAIVHLTIT
jgi:hypothetical protein